MKNILTLRIALLSALLCSFSLIKAQVVNIPDSNFKAALLANAAVNTNGDGEIQTTEAIAYTGTLRVSNKNISDLTGIEAFTGLTALWCDNNNLTSINVSANTKLTTLRCDHNKLTTLDVSNNLKLTDLRCYVNQIGGLNVRANIDLTVLLCFQNKLTELDLGLNENLVQLQCSYNNLTALDISANHALTSLDTRKNQLTALNAKNGNNSHIVTFNTTNNPQLICIQVDDPAYSEANWPNTDPQTLFSADCANSNTQFVNIPDANFKAALVNNPQINRNHDSEIQVSEASVYDGVIRVSSRNISDLTGIEAFTSIRGLECANNTLTTLDVSHNTVLTTLRCDHAGLTTLVLGANPNLTDLRCYYNELTSLDLGGSTGLTTLWCFGNKLSTLDISNSPGMVDLRVNHNKLTSLLIGEQSHLETVYAYSNLLTALDVSLAPRLTDLQFNLNKVSAINLAGNSFLSYLNGSDNQLTTLSLAGNLSLRNLLINNNKLTTLDLRRNSQITEFQASKNPLTALTVKNGNNRIITYFNTLNAPQLLCIEVDDPAWSQQHWPNVDATAGFSTNCNPGGDVVYIPDPNLKSALLALSYVNTNHDNEIQVSEAQAYDNYVPLSGKNISDPTGLEAFTAMKFIDLSGNNLTSLDMRPNTGLVSLECSYNQISELHWGNALSQLSATDNQLTSIDMASTPGIEFVFFHNNPLGSIDVSQNTGLKQLGVKNTGLTSIDVSHNSNLDWLELDDNQLTTLDVSANPLLEGLLINNNHIATIDLSANKKLYQLWCVDNLLTELDLDGMLYLEEFRCSSNRITTLNVGNAPKILTFDCSNNLITNLDVSRANAITYLRIQNNRLTSLNMRNQCYAEEYNVDGTNNPDLHCIEVSDVAHAEEFWRNSFDPGVTFSTNCGSSPAPAPMTLSVYPNPTTDKLTIESTQPIDRVHIFDATGGLLMGTQVGNTVDMSSFQKGVYVIRVQHGENVTPVRIVKE